MGWCSGLTGGRRRAGAICGEGIERFKSENAALRNDACLGSQKSWRARASLPDLVLAQIAGHSAATATIAVVEAASFAPVGLATTKAPD